MLRFSGQLLPTHDTERASPVLRAFGVTLLLAGVASITWGERAKQESSEQLRIAVDKLSVDAARHRESASPTLRMAPEFPLEELLGALESIPNLRLSAIAIDSPSGLARLTLRNPTPGGTELIPAVEVALSKWQVRLDRRTMDVGVEVVDLTVRAPVEATEARIGVR